MPLLAAWLIGQWFRAGSFLPRHPAVRTWTIAVGGATTALLSTWSLVLLGTARIDRVAYITERLHLVGGVLRRAEHVPLPVSVLALVLLAVRLRRVLQAVSVSRRARCAADRFRASNGGALVVVADAQPLAFALAGNRNHGGTVVVSTALFDVVPDEQRRAVFAHENAHLVLHHHRYRAVVNLSIALEPFLAPASTASSTAIERWADEYATNNATERRAAAQAISTFMESVAFQNRLAPTLSTPQMLGGLAYTDNSPEAATQRIAALLSKPPKRWLFDAIPGASLVLLILWASGDATQQLAHLVHTAIR